VLVVEDDEDLRRMYRLTLALARFDVDEARDGLQALQLIDLRSPDLIVLDLLLPGVSGIVVQQELAARAHTRAIPLVIVTGSTLVVDAPCVLRKPVSPDRLLDVVRACLASGLPEGSVTP
jgi:DNA-binding response OmpR family regulator